MYMRVTNKTEAILMFKQLEKNKRVKVMCKLI